MSAKKPNRGGWPAAVLKGLLRRAAPAPKPPAETPPPPAPQSQPEAQPQPESPLILVQAPDASAEIIELEGDLHRLQQQQLAWPFSPPPASPSSAPLPSLDESHYWEIARKLGRWALLGLCILLAALPPFLVFLDRWLLDRQVHDLLRDTWCRSEFFCQLWWPSYFLIIIASAVLLVLLVVFAVRDNRPHNNQAPAAPGDSQEQKAAIRPEQRRIARGLEVLALGWFLLLMLLAAGSRIAPGIELLPAILVYLLGRVLAEYSAGTLFMMLRGWWARFWPLGLAHLSLIVFLSDSSVGRPTALLTFGLLVAALLNLWRLRSRIQTIHWVTLAAVFLFTLNINSWAFSTIGDEYSFFTFGRDILQYQTWDYRTSHFFNGMGVYGSHPYLSSVFHALSMGLLGVNNFGWRFSSLYLAALSIPMFYFFFRRFLDERVSLLGAGMLGCSHYLMTFGKIGYNNLQALFVMGLVLWAAGEAVRSRRALNYTFLGLSLGLVFYVYPAALYVLPLAGLLMLMYDPPFNRPALKRWFLAGVAFFIFFSPLIFQPEYWQAKVAGTLFYNPDIMQQDGGIAGHLARNFLYSLFSFLYIAQESHFVTSSYVDPLSGMLVLLGLAWAIKLLRRDRFAVFLLLGFLLLNFFVGATHDRSTPANTRMFLLLPWFTLLAALGLSWLAWQLQRLHAPPRLATALAVLLLAGILAGNLYQAYSLSRQRSEGQPSMEMLFLRMLQRDASLQSAAMQDAPRRIYLFITEEGWNIDGLRLAQQIYAVPDSVTQLQRVAVTGSELPPSVVDLIQNEDVGVIIQPWMREDWRAALETRLAEWNKKPCVIRDIPTTDPRFTIWWSERWSFTCPADGDWSLPR